MPDPAPQVCRRVLYAGRVQGVGFRWTTHRISRRHPVKGYVCNCPDGTVELVAQGDPQAVDQFLSEIAQVMKKYIDHADSAVLDVQEDLAGFEIRR